MSKNPFEFSVYSSLLLYKSSSNSQSSPFSDFLSDLEVNVAVSSKAIELTSLFIMYSSSPFVKITVTGITKS